MTLTPRLTVFTLVSVLVFLGLAILGWGGFAAFFVHPALTAVVVITVLQTIFALFSGANLSSGEREDRANRWVLAALGVLGLLGAWLPAYTDRRDLWTIDGDTVRWVGVGVYTLGGVLRLWPVFVLGHRLSGLVAIQRGHTLVTTGLYRVIRHPSYLGLLVLSFGWGLVFRSWAGVILAALNIVPLVGRIRAEEALLHAQFGAEYDAYRSRTWRLIPGLY
ncbi:MAG TPA: isoprenylcysteine carboxylmethyltransferase family protein [Acetobacteraceae bacterium]|nr:isoprenylcysteine carboxylmethyltransferase family protein [Acetobacteraceae bacterium]